VLSNDSTPIFLPAIFIGVALNEKLELLNLNQATSTELEAANFPFCEHFVEL